MTLLNQTKVKIQTGQIDNFFDILSDILLKISGGILYKNSKFNKVFSAYMLCRYISMKKELLEYAMILNQLQTIVSPERLYQIAYKIIPKQKYGYIPYIKKNKEKIKKKEEEINIKDNQVKMSIFDL